ncbi:MAG: hypothetical protein J07HQX50_02688, partial [Haloquadratum sp. J07HQX50]
MTVMIGDVGPHGPSARETYADATPVASRSVREASRSQRSPTPVHEWF